MPTPPPEPDEAVRRLRERVAAARTAAERLAAEVEASGRRPRGAEGPLGPGARDAAERPPPAGWRTAEQARETAPELQALAGLLRHALPREVQAQLLELARELLLLLRALVDWWVDRLERRRPAPVEVEDIPIA